MADMASALVLTGMALGALIVISIVFMVLSKLLQLGVRVAHREAPVGVPVGPASSPKTPTHVAEAPQREVVGVAELHHPRPAVEKVVTCPMPGTIISINVSVGDRVSAGDVLLTLESMKIQNEVRAPVDGEVMEIHVSQRANVRRAERLVTIGHGEKPLTPPTIATGTSRAAGVEPSPATVSAAKVVNCPMPGTVLSINVRVGDAVKSGDVLLILESMKIQNEIKAPKDGKVKEVYVSENETVRRGDRLLTIA
jgi:biotin carboxyl carrier protein